MTFHMKIAKAFFFGNPDIIFDNLEIKISVITNVNDNLNSLCQPNFPPLLSSALYYVILALKISKYVYLLNILGNTRIHGPNQ